jgi:hypothetical protein
MYNHVENILTDLSDLAHAGVTVGTCDYLQTIQIVAVPMFPSDIFIKCIQLLR